MEDGENTGRRSRREFLIAGAVVAAGAACGSGADRGAPDPTDGPVPMTTPGTGSTAPAHAAPANTGSSSTTESSTTGAPTPTTTATTGSRFVVRGPASGDQVALTFHTNGDLRLAQRLLDITRTRSTPVTAFVVGTWLVDNPSWARRLLDAGHELGNHTWSHPDSLKLGRAAMDAEIVRCRDLLVKLTGSPGRWFRPSGFDDGRREPTATIMEAAAAAGYRDVSGFDVDPADYRDPGAEAVRTRTLATVAAGSVVSLHFGHAGTLDALPGILDGLAGKSLRPVTLSTLIGG